jgi:FlaA1/EpsC-like NDP-sugar epimerase
MLGQFFGICLLGSAMRNNNKTDSGESVKQKVVLVTGASFGIGKAAAALTNG